MSGITLLVIMTFMAASVSAMGYPQEMTCGCVSSFLDVSLEPKDDPILVAND